MTRCRCDVADAPVMGSLHYIWLPARDTHSDTVRLVVWMLLRLNETIDDSMDADTLMH
jgi:hypothetical protein